MEKRSEISSPDSEKITVFLPPGLFDIIHPSEARPLFRNAIDTPGEFTLSLQREVGESQPPQQYEVVARGITASLFEVSSITGTGERYHCEVYPAGDERYSPTGRRAIATFSLAFSNNHPGQTTRQQLMIRPEVPSGQ